MCDLFGYSRYRREFRNIIQGDATVNALTNEPLASVQSVGSDHGDNASLQQQQQGGTGTQDKLSPNVPRTSLNVSSFSSQNSATGNSTREMIKPMYSFKMKKKDKMKRDKNRVLILDINMQVLRVKDASGKTQKVSSVSRVRRVQDKTSKEIACQLLIEFYDYRDYHLTFKTDEIKLEFVKIIGKLINFQQKLASKYSAINNMPGLLSFESFAGRLRETMEYHSAPCGGGLSDNNDSNIPPSSTANGVHGGGFNSYEAQLNAILNSGRALSGEGAVYTGQKTENVVYQIVKINRYVIVIVYK